MINKIKVTAMMLAVMMMIVMATFSACSTEELTADGGNTAQKALFTVGDFPDYNTDATTRAIGTADAGKTEWAADDVILVKAEQYSGYDATTSAVSGTVGTTTLYKMTCTAAASEGTAATWTTEQWDGSAWTTPTALTAGSYEEGLKITAYYAPNYEWNTSGNALKLISGKTAGTAEMLSVVQQMQFVKLSNAASIAIDFSKVTRDYSRLRIAAVPNATIAFTCAGFTPLGTTTAGVSAVSLTTDAKGNAYMYGSWTASTMAASITVDDTPYSLASKSVTTVPVANTSYALNAMPTTYNQVGAGTSASPYRIYNATQLQDINNGTISHLGTGPSDDYIVICNGAYFSMENDVDCSTISSFTPIGYLDENNKYFAGTFDGNNHTISNLKLGKNGQSSGLFGAIYNATIQNLVLSNPTGTPNTQYVGALAGFARSSKILNCGVTVTDGTYSITNNCSADPTYVGGLVGDTYQAYIVACYANIPVSTFGTSTDGNGQAGYKTGGLVGLVGEGSFVYASYATGNVTAQDNNDIGGLIGYLNSGTVSGCYASGAFSASSSTYVGGLVGQNPYDGTISYCATTSTTGTAAKGGTNGTDYTGIGANANSATVTECYGGITSLTDIRSKIVTPAAETAWLTVRGNLPDTYAGKTMTLDQLWKKDVSSGLKLYWEK